MLKNKEELNKRLEKIDAIIPELKSDIPSEQMVYNQELENYIAELVTYENYIKEVLSKKVKEVIPKANNNILKCEEELNKIKKVLDYSGSDDEYLTRIHLDEIIYKVCYSTNVDVVNKNILEFINLFKKIGLELSGVDFNYSIYTTKYMNYFFIWCNSSDFYMNMKKFFDSIYWECPNIIKQIVLNLINIVEKNKKVIIKYANALYDEALSEIEERKEDINNLYVSYLENYHKLAIKDTFNVYDYFKNNSATLKLFLSGKVDDLYTNYSKVPLKTKEEIDIFITNIDNYGSNIKEYYYIKKYKYIFDYVLDLLKNNNINRDNKKKELIKLIKLKDNFNKKLIKFNLKKDKLKSLNKSSESVDKDIHITSAYLLQYIDSIFKITKEIDEANFIVELKKKINLNSNLYDVILFLSKHYSVLSRLIYYHDNNTDIVEELDEFKGMIYSHDSFIIRNTPIDKQDLIESMIIKKYELCNINASIPDFESGEYESLISDINNILMDNALKLKNINVFDLDVCIKREQD